MAIDIKKVEEIIDYKFKNKKLLEEALTHPPGNTGSPSYERLEFLGDAVIGLAISKHFFWDEHYDLSPNDLTRLRSANVNNDKLARVAAHLGLYHHVQGTNISDSLEQLLFMLTSILICKSYIRRLLKPIITLGYLENHPQPIKELYELCQKKGKQIEIKCERDGYKTTSMLVFTLMKSSLPPSLLS
ncbi:ribonuclease 3-like protein 2 isoform X3 [Ziziphus jujuba]|uniref:Ribonuclease 3-like protein 2 isoform X3 n=1 Tax=Ziziphus jujuba TaxID=326968 RepID=A0ABM4AHI9_ZIZJJ|nr:ribonuclease 3-like protein 2 isoform X3 [Ziziphus jujuba]